MHGGGAHSRSCGVSREAAREGWGLQILKMRAWEAEVGVGWHAAWRHSRLLYMQPHVGQGDIYLEIPGARNSTRGHESSVTFSRVGFDVG